MLKYQLWMKSEFKLCMLCTNTGALRITNPKKKRVGLLVADVSKFLVKLLNPHLI